VKQIPQVNVNGRKSKSYSGPSYYLVTVETKNNAKDGKKKQNDER
jgi:hypothetical protein